MGVNVLVADLRAQPHPSAQAPAHDPLQETQLLYGERVRVLRKRDGWAYVEAVEQPEFTHANRWQGYPGWIPAAALIAWEPQRSTTIVVAEKWASTWQEAAVLTTSPWCFPLGTRLTASHAGADLWRVELLDGTTVWMQLHSAQSIAELATLPAPDLRRLIIRSAQLFVGDPYYWGGRSPAAPAPPASAGHGQDEALEARVTTEEAPSPGGNGLGSSSPRRWQGEDSAEGEAASASERRKGKPAGVPSEVTGVDCSGLVNLAYRAAGIDVPRDAHEQFLRARAVTSIQPADLIFLSKRGNPRRIVHVMLYAGDGEIIEGPGTGLAVRRIALAERLGQPIDRLVPGTVVDGQMVWFGSYLP